MWKEKREGEGAFYELTAFQPALAFWPACSKFSWRQFCSLAVFFLSFSHPFPNKIKNLWGKRKTTTELDWAVGYRIFHLSTSFAYSRCKLQSFPPLLKIQIAYKKGGEGKLPTVYPYSASMAFACDLAFSYIFKLVSGITPWTACTCRSAHLTHLHRKRREGGTVLFCLNSHDVNSDQPGL